MRKFISILLSLSLVLALVACSAPKVELLSPIASTASPIKPAVTAAVSSTSAPVIKEVGGGDIYSKNRIDLPGEYAEVRELCSTADGMFLSTTTTNKTNCFYLLNTDDLSVEKLAYSTLVTLGTYNLKLELNHWVNEFNENSPSTKIKVIDYAEYDAGTDIKTGLTRLNTDIISGFAPDIIDLSNLQVRSYVNAGVLADLGELFATREDIDINAFVPSLINALKHDGKLYYMAPNFIMSTLVGNKDVIGDNNSLSTKQFFTMLEENSIEELIGSYISKEQFLAYTLLFNQAEYVDYDKGTCD